MSALETAYRAALVADSALLAAAVGGVHQDVAPVEEAATALVVFSLQNAVEDATMDGLARISATYEVQGYATDYATAAVLAGRIHAVCSAPTLSGYHVIEAKRDGHLSRREIDEAGKVWWVEGGTYSLQVEAA